MSLDQTIGRQALEEASIDVPSIARGDCARLHREMFGVVAEDLSSGDAHAFQAALRRKNFPTRVVEQARLPVLGHAVKRAGIRFGRDGFAVADGLRRETAHRWDDLHFAAGGFLQVTAAKTERAFEWKHEFRPGFSGRGGTSRHVVVGERDRLVKEDRFRLELFVGARMERLQIDLHKDRLFFFGEHKVRLRQREILEGILGEIGRMLPNERINEGIHAAVAGVHIVYPGVRAFEREIVWHFHRLVE